MLIDRIRAQLPTLPYVTINAPMAWHFGTQKGRPDEAPQIEGLPVFDIAPVAKYFFDGPAEEKWPIEKFLSVRPPFARLWMEFPVPASGLPPWHRELYDRLNVASVGVDVASIAGEGRAIWQIAEEANRAVEQATKGKVADTDPFRFAHKEIEAFVPDSLILLSPVLETRKQEILNLTATIGVAIDPTGAIHSVFTSWSKEDPQSKNMWAAAQPALMALTFLNTVNVDTELVTPAPALQKARERKGKPPFVAYHVIKVPGHTGARSQRSGAAAERALHLVRGHFKRRKTGIYWWHPHLRGSADVGVVRSRYEVQPR